MKEALKKIDNASLISLVTFIGFAVAAAYHFLMKDWGYPHNTFLFRPWDRFNDFFNTIKGGNSPYASEVAGNYFPLGHRIITFFNLFSPEAALMIFLIGFALIFGWLVYKNVPNKDTVPKFVNVFILAFLSYPFLFVMDRGNMEALVFVFLYGFIWLYERNPILSNLCLVAAIGMKVFPAIFLVLLLSDKKYKQIIDIVVLVVGLTILSLFTFTGSVMEKVYTLMEHLDRYNKVYLYTGEGLLFGHSLWGIIGTMIIISGGIISKTATSWYMVIVGVTFIGLTYYVVFLERELWKRVALLVLAMNLLPYVSGDYKLLHIFLPLFLFLNKNTPDKLDKLYAILFGLLLIPKAYYRFPELATFFGQEGSIGIIINPLIMLAFTVIIIVQGLRNRRRVVLPDAR